MNRTYRSSPSTYLGLGIFAFGLSFLILSPLLIEYPPPSLKDKLLGFSFASIISIAPFWWLSCFKLTITPDAVIYSSAFNREQSINLAEIKGAEISVLYERRRLVLVVQTYDGIKMRINPKVFSKKAYQDLCDAVKA